MVMYFCILQRNYGQVTTVCQQEKKVIIIVVEKALANSR
jgi:hypothetical protein